MRLGAARRLRRKMDDALSGPSVRPHQKASPNTISVPQTAQRLQSSAEWVLRKIALGRFARVKYGGGGGGAKKRGSWGEADFLRPPHKRFIPRHFSATVGRAVGRSSKTGAHLVAEGGSHS